MKLKHLIVATLACSSLLTACGAGTTVDKVDRATLVEGTIQTRNLKFWMKERAGKGDAIVPNVHFDDGANQRIVLWYEEPLTAKVGTLEQGKTYKVSFKYEAGDELVYGTMTAVE